MKNAFILLGFALLLSSCASLSETQCRGGDWTSIGLRDGAAGREVTYVARHREACAEFGIMPDVAAWQAGRDRGLVRYCTPLNAWEEGARGNSLSPVCPADESYLLTRQNRRGLEYHEIGQDIDRREREIDQINRQLATLEEASPLRPALMSERASLRLEILRLRAMRARVRL